MTPGEVAAVFRVDPKTVTRWAKTGKLDSIRTLGGVRRYYADQVAGFLAAGSRTASQPGTPDHGSAAPLPDAAATPARPDHPTRPPAQHGHADETGPWVTAAPPPHEDTATTPGPHRTLAPRPRPGMPAFRAPEEPPSTSS